MDGRVGEDEVTINWGNLLEDQLEKWRGGGRHAAGIAEYISNSDDSYRRLKKFRDQPIDVEIHSKSGRHIDRLVVRDAAEGMSFEDLEGKFFQYFESQSGREKGALVSGRFGTGGKAYAIMNFKHCWITSVKDGRENRAWFKWDAKRKRIVRGYDNEGYKNQPVKKPNGTTVELVDSLKVSHELVDLVGKVEKLPRIRHVIKQQRVTVRFRKKHEDVELLLRYAEPQGWKKEWEFSAPPNLCADSHDKPMLVLRYFEEPLEDNFIDVSDGISSVADVDIPRLDARPFSRYFNGAITLKKLRDSKAVRENRKGLEEGDDLTVEIEAFLKGCSAKAISEVEELQRQKERDRRLSASHEKMRELSKFLRKCDMRFRTELRELRKRFTPLTNSDSDSEDDVDVSDLEMFRKPVAGDRQESLIRGKWVIGHSHNGHGNGGGGGIPKFIVDPDGPDLAVKVGSSKRSSDVGQKKTKQGLIVVMSDDQSVSDCPVFGKYDDPVNDRDMVTRGIVWINANHPLIEKRRERSDNDPVFLEMVANYVLMVVAQYFSTKQSDTEPDDEKTDLILLFRQHFFRLQRDLREDSSISYFESEQTGRIAELSVPAQN